MTVCFKIKELRQKAGMTQKDLAEKMGFRSSSIVTMWESGDRNPKSELLPALARALNCEIGDLYVSQGPHVCPDSVQPSA